ncbi:hypothetical protein MLAC_13970 [Mycobacterium lacus]|uniref:Uncharacterized protein n=1 Tax=Mycobacterium lacus TaxID=169765 RepID=A0A7I7NIJ9_9MYCO|nr:hypothetical protein MLAC_13970 [Mycobacterium lacus]
MRQKPIHHCDVVALPGGGIRGKQENVSVTGYPKPHRHLPRGKPPTSSVNAQTPHWWDLTCTERVAPTRAG